MYATSCSEQNEAQEGRRDNVIQALRSTLEFCMLFCTFVILHFLSNVIIHSVILSVIIFQGTLKKYLLKKAKLGSH